MKKNEANACVYVLVGGGVTAGSCYAHGLDRYDTLLCNLAWWIWGYLRTEAIARALCVYGEEEWRLSLSCVELCWFV